jgi:hypothetical protein
MNFIEGIKEKFKQFKPTSWAVDIGVWLNQV